ncbi:hypothetical protein MTR67_038477 [Solanum verrucosum]|uniref:Uncharacterized protein n=1 Tax=Solanum verrucosum TaxID=315347 RepID=A0AAF0ZMT3_SOLVR|nr:hypothetical protein MTR67_038477 [Solanum verrucosum]
MGQHLYCTLEDMLRACVLDFRGYEKLRIRKSQRRQKNYVDRKRHPLNFGVGEHIFLCVTLEGNDETWESKELGLGREERKKRRKRRKRRAIKEIIVDIVGGDPYYVCEFIVMG